MLGGR